MDGADPNRLIEEEPGRLEGDSATAGEARSGDPVSELGVSDLAAVHDTLDLGAYQRGLVEFLARCPTPMTVAVQGEWGSGKTSLLNLVSAELKDDLRVARVITFNTWEMAFLDDGPLLTLALMQQILAEIEVKGSSVKREEILKALGRVALVKSLELAPVLAAGAPVPLVGKVVGKASEALVEHLNRESSQPGIAEEVLRVRTLFGEQVHEFLTQHPGASRVVVLIDDLDRLPPARAVELMESLKSIMDCAGCVFVVAVDFDVVAQGVRHKYPAMGEEKARSFFDKLVQVPFRMPPGSQESVGALVRQALDRKDLGDLAFYTKVCWLASDGNPRAAKRVLNSFLLMMSVRASIVLDQKQDAPTGAAPLSADAGESAEHLLFCLQALDVAFPTASARIQGADEDLAVAAGGYVSSGMADDMDSASRRRLEQLLAELVALASSNDGSSLDMVSQLASATSVSGSGGRINKQDHTPNEDVQKVISRLFERVAVPGANDERPPASVPNALAQVDAHLASSADWTITHVRRTRGRGQGLYFYLGRRGGLGTASDSPDDDAPRIYLSGDSKGRLPNDGFAVLSDPPIRYHGMSNGQFDATTLVRDIGQFEQFYGAVVDGLRSLVAEYAHRLAQG
ncbi:P-loop NTPase fold protein [Arsenicicoccus dermatophilus]|uniref:KAP family P-loop NTPase fold protein n=1 Tax=Arsenicicoccus dermatophilus TaxID=1076331 RepID=UPI0039175127